MTENESRLTELDLTMLAMKHNWAEARYDNNGVLVRSLKGGDDATDWTPVSASQLQAVKPGTTYMIGINATVEINHENLTEES